MAQVPRVHAHLPQPPPQQSALQLRTVHAVVRLRVRDGGPRVGHSVRGGDRGRGGAVQDARRGVSGARHRAAQLLPPLLHVQRVRVATVRDEVVGAPVLAARRARRMPRAHLRAGVLLRQAHARQDADRDVGDARVCDPVLLQARTQIHQRAHRERHPQGRCRGRQGDWTWRLEQSGGSQRRRSHLHKGDARLARARGARQHAHRRRHPPQAPRRDQGGVPHGRHLQAWSRARALSLGAGGARSHVHLELGAVRADREGGEFARAARSPRSRGAPRGRRTVRHVGRRQVLARKGAATRARGDHLPPVRRASHPGGAQGLPVHRPPRVPAPQIRARVPHVRDDDAAQLRARLPRRRARARARGLDPPRGGED
mmetsp:Transcript_30914/g.100645  ORF Transcript_30914/g.100645 Transcript_30914/m.100645 type:complete len:371 (+) Transcript_30914:941-2053(+)